MTNKLFTILVFAVLSVALISCDSSQKTIEIQKRVYTTAIGADDYATALNAAHQIVGIDKQSTYLDSIAGLYFLVGNNFGAEKIALECLKLRPKSIEVRRVLAKAQKNMGKYSDALLTYQELIKEDESRTLDYEYSIGECFFFMENFQSCLEYMKKVTDKEQSTTKEIELVFNQKRQKVSYYLAAMNTIAYVLTISGSPEQGISLYKQILERKPDFALAMSNYEYALKLEEENSKGK